MTGGAAGTTEGDEIVVTGRRSDGSILSIAQSNPSSLGPRGHAEIENLTLEPFKTTIIPQVQDRRALDGHYAIYAAAKADAVARGEMKDFSIADQAYADNYAYIDRLDARASSDFTVQLQTFGTLYAREAAMQAAGGVAGKFVLAPAVRYAAPRIGQFAGRISGGIVSRLRAVENGAGARFGLATSNDYRATFFVANPGLKGQVVVHHAVEQQTLKLYPNQITAAEINFLENLRGIPLEVNSNLHLSTIRKEWNRFYLANPDATKTQLLQHASKVDIKYGSQFNPPLGR